MITKFIQTSEQRQQSTDATLRNHEAFIHNLENQVGQIAKLLSERPQGSLPGNTEPNPREQLKAVTLRSGKELKSNVGNEPDILDKKSFEAEKGKPSDVEDVNERVSLQPYKPTIPYPERLRKNKDQEQFGKFLTYSNNYTSTYLLWKLLPRCPGMQSS